MTTAIIVQARTRSTRLPGKILRSLRGETVLRHVLHRCRAVEGVDAVCCATTDDPADDPVAEEAARCGVAVFRGSEGDVLARYDGAARALGASVVMRVTSDCPLIDPAVCADVLRLLARTGADYAANNTPPGWPHGLDCEAFPAHRLAEAAREARRPSEREHVTPWLRTHPDLTRANLPCPWPDVADLRWTLDHPEDLAFLEALFALLPPFPAIPTTRAVLDVLASHPALTAINADRRDHGRGAAPPDPIPPDQIPPDRRGDPTS